MSVHLSLTDRRAGGRQLGARARRWWVALLVAVLCGVAAPARGQQAGVDSSSVVPSGVVAENAAGVGTAPAGISPLPPPATGEAYRHVFLAFGIAWALILGYALMLNRRIAAAERDLRRLNDPGA
jgi:CcmD family protein